MIYELRAAEGKKRKDCVSVDSKVSIDWNYHTWHEAITNYSQPSNGEIDFQIGDKIRFEVEKTNKTVGYGVNKRTKQKGYYSTSKVKAHIMVREYEGFGY